jgi:UDP-N-acetyl-D-galactosamine dehydrogenase
VIDIVNALAGYHLEPVVYDPWANIAEVEHEYGLTIYNEIPEGNYGAAVLAVAHDRFAGLELRNLVGEGVLYDVKGVLPKEHVDARL